VKKPLALWSTFVLVFASLSYGVRFTEGKPPRNLLYKWSTAEANLIQFGVILAIVYGIAGLGNRRQLLALRRPTSWATAARVGAGIAVAMIALTYLLEPVLHPGREQGVTPDTWQPKHAGAYIANAIVIAVVAPFVEELTFRGLGYSLLVPYGRWTAIIVVGIAFGLAHGLVQAFPFLAAFGAGLAYLRSRVDSVYPGMIVHGLFNALALTVAVVDKPQAASILRACGGVWSGLLPF
jgi:membrane protease YdiL (CAAX protease family)